MYKYLLVIFLLVLSVPISAQIEQDTVHLFFNLDVPALNDKMKTRIDSVLHSNNLAGTNIVIVGYADYLGKTDHNDILSQERAKNVQAYLVKSGIQQEQIKICIGKGQIMRRDMSKEGYAPDRKVDIVIERGHLPEVITPPTKPTTATTPPPTPIVPDTVIKFRGKPKKDTLAAPTPVLPRSSDSAIKFYKQPKKDTTHRTSVVKQVPTPGKDTIINLSQYKKGETFVLRNIYFETGRHVLVPSSVPELTNLYNALSAYPNIKIQIEGHICCLHTNTEAEDDDTHEIALSVNRAKYIYDYLISKGIDAERLRFVGYGNTRPLVREERTPEDQGKNRRVEIRIIENE